MDEIKKSINIFGSKWKMSGKNKKIQKKRMIKMAVRQKKTEIVKS